MTSATQTSNSIINSASPILVCCWFILLSTILTLHNKYVLDEVFRSSNGVLTCQCIFAITTLLIARRLGYVSHFHASPLTATRMELFCSGCASLNVVTGLGALAFVNVVTHGVLKRGAIVASWIIEFLFERKDSTIKVVPAVGILIFGSIVAGYGDLKFSVIGYTLAIISCFAQGSMFELGRRLVVSNGGNTNEGSSKKSSDSSSSYSAVLYLNSLATVVVALPLFFVNARETAKTAVASHIDDDHTIVSSTSQQLTFSFLLTNAKIMPSGVSAALFHLSFNGLISLLMNHAIFWNCAVNSSLAHTVSGNLKAALQTLFGAMLFVTPLNFTGWVGVGFNILGATTFSVIRLRNSTSKQQQQQQQVSSTSMVNEKEGKMHQHQHQHQQIGSDSTKQQQSGV